MAVPPEPPVPAPDLGLDRPRRRRLLAVSCDILHRELCAAIASSPNEVDPVFLPKGLHDAGRKSMLPKIQAAVDQADPERYDAVVVGYGLCSYGIAGLRARELPLVIPRAHDCITLFFGNLSRYEDYFNEHPATYFLTTGWLERGGTTQLNQSTMAHIIGPEVTLEELTARYGEQNGLLLYDALARPLRHYTAFVYLRMDFERDDRFVRLAQEMADAHGVGLVTIPGDMGMVQRLVDGPWDDASFLVVAPGCQVRATCDSALITAEPTSS